MLPFPASPATSRHFPDFMLMISLASCQIPPLSLKIFDFPNFHFWYSGIFGNKTQVVEMTFPRPVVPAEKQLLDFIFRIVPSPHMMSCWSSKESHLYARTFPWPESPEMSIQLCDFSTRTSPIATRFTQFTWEAAVEKKPVNTTK